jgi:thymidylate synthase ThyX
MQAEVEEAEFTYSAQVLLDSVSPQGVRLTTLQVRFPRFILAEFNTHRVFSRNSASSRAVPTKKLLGQVFEAPVLPLEWGKNKSGMSADEELSDADQYLARQEWLLARDSALASAEKLLKLGVHKQVVNRILEPFLWHTVIVTATEWENFFTLRLAKNAQPEMQITAKLMLDAYTGSTPEPVAAGQWHLPLVQPDERHLPVEQLTKISAARCARVSYLTHDGKREIEKDIELCERLRADRHLSPFEHVATPAGDASFHANFRGWVQMRKEIERAIAQDQ